jgi:hypothetical protein
MRRHSSITFTHIADAIGEKVTIASVESIRIACPISLYNRHESDEGSH